MCFVTAVMVFQECLVADRCTQLLALPSSCLDSGHTFKGAAQPYHWGTAGRKPDRYNYALLHSRL